MSTRNGHISGKSLVADTLSLPSRRLSAPINIFRNNNHNSNNDNPPNHRQIITSTTTATTNTNTVTATTIVAVRRKSTLSDGINSLVTGMVSGMTKRVKNSSGSDDPPCSR